MSFKLLIFSPTDMVYSLIQIELASQFACKLYWYHIHIFTATEILCSLFSYRLYPRFILGRPPECYNSIKRARFHATETETAGRRHFIILIAYVYIERAYRFSLAFLTLLTLRPVVADAPHAALSAQTTV